MLAVGITGGIGAGKSALADLLVDKGATLIDADVIAREVVAPGSETLALLQERFGPEVLEGDGSLDRQAMAELAFADPSALEDLNAIVHPAIGSAMAAKRAEVAAQGGIALFAVPLFTAEHREILALDVVVVVDCPIELAVVRLVDQRGFSEADARARIAAQMSREERLELADHVIINDGNRHALEEQAAELWQKLSAAAKRHG